ncbi:glycosyltransferase family 4 protein [uncultured Desulfobulbus sp.]|uniref:glycosyltransferase family 4 protein n=1 Tax=uncultured Desulfobulbus sp. TaxID=239745 RepID=UPI0029C64DB3|nr:glycosyltransferase family 4 protein [uncultured Desulfobulbus sp.]
MNVLILTTSFPLEDYSSSGIFVARLVNNLALQHEVTVITPGDHKHRLPFINKGVRVIPFRYAPYRWQVISHAPGGIPVALRCNRALYLLIPFLLVGFFLTSLKWARDMNVLHANWAACGLIAGIVGKYHGIPVVTTIRGEDITRSSRLQLDNLILTFCMRLSDRIIGVSQAIVDRLKQRVGVIAEQVCLIENGVDEELFLVQHEWCKDGFLRLIFIGSLIPRKGVDTLLKAINAFGPGSSLLLSIVGEGVEEIALREQVGQYGLTNNVKFHGMVAPEYLSTLLTLHDVLVLPSYSEGRPNVVLEAMAAGLPVIASDIPGVDELVLDGRTGLLFVAGNVTELFQCLDTLMRDKALLEKMGGDGRKQILERGLLWSVTAEKYTRLYQSVQRGSI